MSIHYFLYLNTPRSPTAVLEQVEDHLARALGLSRANGAGSTAEMEGLWISARAVEPPVTQMIVEEHGVHPTVSVSMRLDKERLALAQDNVVSLLAVFVHEDTCDLVLLRDSSDEAVYRRVSGVAHVGESPLWHVPERRARVET
ncbi:MAG: SitI3 family protein [Pseudomonadota bacterium]